MQDGNNKLGPSNRKLRYSAKGNRALSCNSKQSQTKIKSSQNINLNNTTNIATFKID